MPAVNPAWLASSADRERTVGVLRAGFTEGRLTEDELDDRVALAYTARTYEQLWALTADLPAGAVPYPTVPYPTGPYPTGPYPTQPQGAVVPVSAAPASSWKPAAALIITALIIFTLAALITAVITAHTQTVVYTPPLQHVNLMPVFKAQPGMPILKLGPPPAP